MSPNDEYLCVVPSRGDKDPKVYLPFEEDGGMLSIILSKAFLLADDRNISDAEHHAADQRPLTRTTSRDAYSPRRCPL